MTGPGRAARTLLDLAGTDTSANLEALDASEWQDLARMAALHRLGPWLHSRHGDNVAIPKDMRAEWATAHRQSALAAMVQQADCADACAVLEQRRFHPVALKGAFLARHAYPHSALRPMRDIDLLVPADRVLDAYEVLRANGYGEIRQGKIALDDAARLDQHMPPLQAPRGTVIELHARLTERYGRLEYATPQGGEAGVIERAVGTGGIRYPAPADLLAHLVVHAVYGHRFDCGPLLLTDVHFLAETQEIDWPLFWSRANSEGWAAGGALVLALVRHYHGAARLPCHALEPAAPDDATVDLARGLLLQDYTNKTNTRFLATLLSGGLTKAWQRASGTVTATGEAGVTINRTRDGGRLAWTLARLRSVAATLADPAQRRQARDLARFRRWLEH